MKVITLLTDFGYHDSYVAEMKGVILKITKNVIIVDITHDVQPQNVEQAAFLLYTCIPYFPEDTIHVGVVDPGVGTSRKSLIIDCKNYFLVGPDNGLLIPSAKRSKEFRVFEIKNKDFLPKEISPTFHGRDIFAPVAAYLARGISVENLGEEIEDYIDLDLEFGKLKGSVIEGKIMHVDRFGNLITNIEGKIVLDRIKYGDYVDVNVEGKDFKLPFLKSYGFAKRKEIFLTVGGNGFLEIGMNMGSAYDKIGKGVGEKIILTL